MLDDGNFTLILVKTARLFDMLGLMIQAINGGQHVTDANVEYLKTSKLKLEVLDKSTIYVEFGQNMVETLLLELEVLHNHLEFFANIDD